MKRVPKEHIVFMKAKFDNLEQHSDILTLLRTNYKALNYPFGYGYGKVQYSCPVKDPEGGYFITGSVYMNHRDYIKKCANSDSEILHQVCAEWIKVNYPELLGDFFTIKQQYTTQKAELMAKRNLESYDQG